MVVCVCVYACVLPSQVNNLYIWYSIIPRFKGSFTFYFLNVTIIAIVLKKNIRSEALSYPPLSDVAHTSLTPRESLAHFSNHLVLFTGNRFSLALGATNS